MNPAKFKRFLAEIMKNLPFFAYSEFSREHYWKCLKHYQ